MRQGRHLKLGRSADADTLAKGSEALGGTGASSREGGSRAAHTRAGIGDERLSTFRMQPPQQKGELLVSASSGIALSLGDVTGAGLGKKLSTALREGAALEAPLDGTSGAQRVLIASTDSAVSSDAFPSNVAEARARFVSERPEGAADKADGAPALLGGGQEEGDHSRRAKGG